MPCCRVLKLGDKNEGIVHTETKEQELNLLVQDLVVEAEHRAEADFAAERRRRARAAPSRIGKK